MTWRTRGLAAVAGTVGFSGIVGLLLWDPPNELVFRLMAFGGLWVLSEVKLGVRERDPRFRPASVRAIRHFNRRAFACLIALLVALPMILSVAARWGMTPDLSFWNERRVDRVLMLVVGILIATIGNYGPKLISPFRSEQESLDWQTSRRFMGWVVCLSGVAFVCASFLPWGAARALVIGAVVSQVGVIFVVLAQRVGRLGQAGR